MSRYSRKKRALISQKGESSRYHLYSHIPITCTTHRTDKYNNLTNRPIHALSYAFRAFNGATRYSLLKPVVTPSPPVPVQPSCSKATFNTHCSKRSSSYQTALSEEILYLLLFLATFSILYIIITVKICQARISTNRTPNTFFKYKKLWPFFVKRKDGAFVSYKDVINQQETAGNSGSAFSTTASHDPHHIPRNRSIRGSLFCRRCLPSDPLYGFPHSPSCPVLRRE